MIIFKWSCRRRIQSIYDPPGIYNCCKGKTSTAHSIPIIVVGTLFHIQTCADNVIWRSERIENKWICWHRRLGHMPLETLKNMVGSCQGLDDLKRSRYATQLCQRKCSNGAQMFTWAYTKCPSEKITQISNHSVDMVLMPFALVAALSFVSSLGLIISMSSDSIS